MPQDPPPDRRASGLTFVESAGHHHLQRLFARQGTAPRTSSPILIDLFARGCNDDRLRIFLTVLLSGMSCFMRGRNTRLSPVGGVSVRDGRFLRGLYFALRFGARDRTRASGRGSGAALILILYTLGGDQSDPSS